MNDTPEQPAQEQPPILNDDELAALTAFRAEVSAEVQAQKTNGQDISETLVAVDASGNLVHVSENHSDLPQYFTVRTGNVRSMAHGEPVARETIGYGTMQGMRFKQSGTRLTLSSGSTIQMPGPSSAAKVSTLNGNLLYQLGEDGRPIPLEG